MLTFGLGECAAVLFTNKNSAQNRKEDNHVKI